MVAASNVATAAIRAARRERAGVCGGSTVMTSAWLAVD
jgi:hypothetical protein